MFDWFDPQWFVQWGYVGLFVVCFLSSSVVPLAAEVVLLAMQQLGFNVWLLLLVGTLGNLVGKLTTYAIGRYGGSYVLERLFHPGEARMQQAHDLFARWGGPIVFWSFLPVIGDAITFVAGVLKDNPWHFVFWVFIGHWLRFAAVVGLFQAGVSLFTR